MTSTRSARRPAKNLANLSSPLTLRLCWTEKPWKQASGEALLEHVIGTEEPDYTTPYDLNIIGEYNLSGELWQVKPLLDELGIRIFSLHLRRREVSRSCVFSPCPRIDDGMFQSDDQCRTQDGRAVRNSILRRMSFYGITDVERFPFARSRVS